MGVTIAYQGRLHDPAAVPELVRDLQATAKAAGWLCKTMEELVSEGRVACSGLRGITLYPHRECEPLHFHFDAAGHFTNHMYFTLLHDAERAAEFMAAVAESSALVRESERRRGIPEPVLPPRDPAEPSFFERGSRHVWTKTQFAGAQVHIAVCEVLRYVKERYAPELQVKDDTGYFETGDLGELEGQLALVDRLVGVTRRSVEATARSGPVTLEGLLTRLNVDLARAKDELH